MSLLTIQEALNEINGSTGLTQQEAANELAVAVAAVASSGALTLTNTTTDNTISVDQNGNVGTAVATDGALHIENTGNTGIGLGVYTNIGATADAPLVSIHADNTAFDQTVVNITNDGTQFGLVIGNYGAGSSGLDILMNGTGGFGLKIFSGGNARGAGSPLASLSNKNSTDVAPCIILNHSGSGNGTHIRFTGDCPNTTSVDGDFWFDGTNLKLNVAGTVYNIDKTTV